MADPRAKEGAILSLEEPETTGPETFFVEAVRQALAEEMERDGRVILIGEDIGHYGGAFRATDGLLSRFGERRVIDTPISEEAVIGGAIGAALRGLRPVAELQFMDFAARAFDLLVNFAAKYRYRTGLGVPMVVRGPCGAGVHGGPFHSQTPEAWFTHVPGMKVVFPATARDAKGLLKAAIRDDDPVLFLEHKFLYRRVRDRIPVGDGPVPIGVSAVRRPGRDLTIVTYGAMLWTALEGAAELSKEGIEAEVLDLRTLRPLDEEAILASVARTSRCLILHEDTRTMGVGAEVAAVVSEKAFARLDAPVVRIAAPDTPVPFSPPLEEAFLPNTRTLVTAARQLAAW